MSIKVSYVEEVSVVNSQLPGEHMAAVMRMSDAKIQQGSIGDGSSRHREKWANQQKDSERRR